MYMNNVDDVCHLHFTMAAIMDAPFLFPCASHAKRHSHTTKPDGAFLAASGIRQHYKRPDAAAREIAAFFAGNRLDWRGGKA
jgi:hypothetical protein